MFDTILELVINSAEGAFIEVGVFVGAVLLLFGYVNFKGSGAFVRAIEKSRKWQPVVGALLGLIPGCGGAIFIMPLFFKGTVTYGTVIATLIATMGDSAFVIIATHPLQYLFVSILSLCVAVLAGYMVDQTGLGEKLLQQYASKKRNKRELTDLHKEVNHVEEIYHIGHHEGDEIDLVLHHQVPGHQEHQGFGYYITHTGFPFYWVLIAIGLVLGIMGLFQVDVNELVVPNLGVIVGVAGTILSIFFMIMGKKLLGNDTHEETEHKAMSLKQTFIHNAQETAFVITWVFAGFLAYEFFVLALGGGNYFAGEGIIESLLMTVGIMSIIIGAGVGLIPGCGPQIIFVALFSRGLIPFAALFANAISQDGDALFPLLAIDKRSALWATLITTVPALIFGLIIYWFELHTVLGKLLNI